MIHRMASANHLLTEVQSESLQKLLVSLRAHDTLETRIPALDSCLFNRHGLHWGDLIHVYGPSGSGKSLLVYLLIVTCCMPLKYLSHPIGGWDKMALVLDMDGTFDVDQLRQILVEKLSRFVPSVSLHPMLKICLKRVHIFRPRSTEQLAATLFHLPRYYASMNPDVIMGMIIIHSLEAFLWVDHFKAEASVSSNRTTIQQNILVKLDDLRRAFGAVCVISHWGLSSTFIHPSSDARTPNPQSNPPQVFQFYLSAETRKDVLEEESGIFHVISECIKVGIHTE